MTSPRCHKKPCLKFTAKFSHKYSLTDKCTYTDNILWFLYFIPLLAFFYKKKLGTMSQDGQCWLYLKVVGPTNHKICQVWTLQIDVQRRKTDLKQYAMISHTTELSIKLCEYFNQTAILFIFPSFASFKFSFASTTFSTTVLIPLEFTVQLPLPIHYTESHKSASSLVDSTQRLCNCPLLKLSRIISKSRVKKLLVILDLIHWFP